MKVLILYSTPTPTPSSGGNEDEGSRWCVCVCAFNSLFVPFDRNSTEDDSLLQSTVRLNYSENPEPQGFRVQGSLSS